MLSLVCIVTRKSSPQKSTSTVKWSGSLSLHWLCSCCLCPASSTIKLFCTVFTFLPHGFHSSSVLTYNISVNGYLQFNFMLVALDSSVCFGSMTSSRTVTRSRQDQSSLAGDQFVRRRYLPNVDQRSLCKILVKIDQRRTSLWQTIHTISLFTSLFVLCGSI